jgi:hypothetical protein
MVGSNGDHSVGIEILDWTARKGVDCQLDQNPAGSNSILDLSDDFNNLHKSIAFNWSSNTQYRIVTARHGAAYTCNVVGPAGMQSLSGSSTVVPRDGNAVDIWPTARPHSSARSRSSVRHSASFVTLSSGRSRLALTPRGLVLPTAAAPHPSPQPAET